MNGTSDFEGHLFITEHIAGTSNDLKETHTLEATVPVGLDGINNDGDDNDVHHKNLNERLPRMYDMGETSPENAPRRGDGRNNGNEEEHVAEEDNEETKIDEEL